MNYFIEGLQGAGKSTLMRQISDRYPNLRVFREGDYSPIELAWCAYVTACQYEKLLKKYEKIEREIKEKTVYEEDNRVICYTQISTDVPEFYEDLEHYEIYNGNIAITEFEEIVMKRFAKWNGDNQVFECSIFQNIIENLMLYLELTDEEIIQFYNKISKTLSDKKMKIIYLYVDDIASCIDVIRKERTDGEGNEQWFKIMVQYIENSPYAKHNNLKGIEGLIKHLERRRDLEQRIIREFFAERSVVLPAKQYNTSVLENIISD